MKESLIQNKWVEALKKEFEKSIYIFKVPVGPYTSRRGIADLCACINGKYYSFEIKTAIGSLTKLQAHEISKVNEAGGYAVCLYGFDQTIFESLVRTIKER